MKKSIYIALLTLLTSMAYGQKKNGNICAIKVQKADPCAIFNCYADGGYFAEAYGLYIQNKTAGCKEADYLLNVPRVLMSNKRFDEARYALQDFHLAFPDDKRYDNEMSRLDELLEFHKNPKPIEIILLAEMSGSANELIGWLMNNAPVPLTDQGKSMSTFPVVRNSGNSYTVMNAPRGNVSKQYRAVADKLDSQEFLHVGPGEMVNDSILFFTAVEGGPYSLGASKGKLKIYSMNVSKGASNPEELPICMNGFNDAFPTYNSRHNSIIFSSDRPGGSGGMDLWVSRFENKRWSEPVLMEGAVNSQWNELFPHQYKDTLYYSSNRPDMGYGGFDIYAYHQGSNEIKNLGGPVNTPSNDFRIVFASETDAFFVSDRPSPLLGDNIYKIKWSEKNLFFDVISGGADWLSKAAGSKVILIDKVTLNQHTAVIGTDGKFYFHNIKGMSDFELQMPEVEMSKGDKLSLFAADGTVIKELVSNGSKSFHFELLSPMDYYLTPLAEAERVLLNSDIVSKILMSMTRSYRKIEIKVLDSNGKLIGTTITDENGEVVFKPAAGSTLAARVDCRIADANDNIHIYDFNGKLLTTISSGSDDITTTITIPAGHPAITFIGYSELTALKDWRDLTIEAAYYDLNKHSVTDASIPILQKVAEMLISQPALKLELAGHTDSRGAASYNMILSKKRADYVRNYLIKAGVSGSRITVRAFGESELINHCADEIECSEEEHALNRRTEFRFTGFEEYTDAI